MLSCIHLSREKAFHIVLQQASYSYEFWDKAKSRLKYSARPSQDVIDDMHAGPLGFQRFRNTALILASFRMRCHVCNSNLQALDFPDTFHPPSNEDPNSHDTDSSTSHISISPATSSRIESNLPKGTRPPVEEIPITSGEDSDNDNPSNRPLKEAEFDDYTSALSVSYPHDPDILPNTWAFDATGMLVLEHHWSLWRDRGYRLERSFFSMFSGNVAPQLIDHLLPHCPGILQTQKQPDAMEREDQLGNRGLSNMEPDAEEALLQGPHPDLITMSAHDMLDEAGPAENTPESQNVFVRGKSRDDKFIFVDLERDKVDLLKQDLAVSIDIDSIIWVTYDLTFLGPMNLHLLPLLGDKPPFATNNHVYVKVLSPPTPDNCDLQGKSSHSSTFSLSQIPHTHFGQMGQGAGQLNIYIFFPRMIRKNRHNGRMATLIPKVVQDLWLSEAVIPAARNSLHNFPGLMEYLPHNVEELHLRSGHRHGTKTIPLTPQTLLLLQTNLRELVQSQADLLGRFGSFFFAVDARGIKLLSKQHQTTEDPYQTLCSMIPELDWNHMMNRLHGELFLDLGVSYHPPQEGEALVGLWRLPQVETSYQIMGMQKGTTHHSCTLESYGGWQAEMKKERRKRVHLCFRSTYNLCFQVIRNPGQAQYLCTDDDAIKINDRFLAGCDRWKTLFHTAQKNSYGVREEIRGSGNAIMEVLQNAMQKVFPTIEAIYIYGF